MPVLPASCAPCRLSSRDLPRRYSPMERPWCALPLAPRPASDEARRDTLLPKDNSPGSLAEIRIRRRHRCSLLQSPSLKTESTEFSQPVDDPTIGSRSRKVPHEATPTTGQSQQSRARLAAAQWNKDVILPCPARHAKRFVISLKRTKAMSLKTGSGAGDGQHSRRHGARQRRSLASQPFGGRQQVSWPPSRITCSRGKAPAWMIAWAAARLKARLSLRPLLASAIPQVCEEDGGPGLVGLESIEWHGMLCCFGQLVV